MRYISEEDIKRLVNHDLVWTLEILQKMYLTMEKGDFSLGGHGSSHGMRMEYQAEGKDNLFIAMPGYLGEPFHVSGVKWHGPNRRREGADRDSHYIVILNDCKTGMPKACMPATYITLYRTAAMSMLAARYLANKDAETIGIIGPGKINTLLTKGLLMEFPGISRVLIKGRGKASCEKFIRSIGEFDRKIKIDVADSLEEAINSADIVSINTGFEFENISDMPIIRDAWIKKGTVFLCSAFVKFSDKFIQDRAINVCDLFGMYESYGHELGIPTYKHLSYLGNRYVDLIRDGRLKREAVFDMKEIVAGKAAARKTREDVVLFSSGGLATQDLAVCEEIYRKAIKEGAGIELPY